MRPGHSRLLPQHRSHHPAQLRHRHALWRAWDIATNVRNGVPIDVAAGHVNVIWQGDANSHTFRCLRHCTSPTSPLNVTGPETASVRELAHAFGRQLGKEPVITGTEDASGWLADAGEASETTGRPFDPSRQDGRLGGRLGCPRYDQPR